MQKLKLLSVLFLLLFAAACPVAHAQWDTPVPIRWVSVLPATCDPTKRVNVLVYKYSSPIGFYYCSGSNTWTQVNASAGTGITDLSGLTSSSQSFATGTAGTDFTINSTGVTHTFNFPTASAVNRGLLSSADWSTFSGKMGSLNGLTGAIQTFATGTSGTDFNIVSSGTAHTFNIPTASSSVRGLLSSADWSTFNSKFGSLNGLSTTAQTFAVPSAADTAAWISSGSTHTLGLPITAVTGTSRTNYLPYFSAANTLAKSGLSWNTSGFFTINNANADNEFTFQLTQSAGSSGSMLLGDFNGISTSYMRIDANTNPIATDVLIQSPSVEIGDFEGNIPGSNTNFRINGHNLGDPNFMFASQGGIIDFGGAGSGATTLRFNATITTTGVTGNQTINKSVGSVNFAAGATSLVLTDSAIKADSLIFCTVQSNDTTAKSCSVSGTAVGSTTVRVNAAATAETKVAFFIANVSF